MKLFRLKFTSSSIEHEYNKIKDANMKSFFKLLVFILVIFTLLGVAQAIRNGSVENFIRVAVIFLVCLFLLKYGQRIERFIDYILATLCLLLHISGVVNNGNTVSALPAAVAQPFASMYHTAYLAGIFERLAILELTRLELKVVFSTISLVIRLVMLPASSVFGYIYICFFWALCLFVDIRRERNDRALFKAFYDFREEIIKFKNLMVSGLPTSVLILSKDFRERLFVNEYFHSTFKIDQNDDRWTPHDWLHSHFIEKESVSSGTLRNEIYGSLNLEEFLEILIEKDFLKSQGHISFNTKMIIENDNEDSNEEIYEETSVFETKILSMMWDGKDAVVILMNDVTEQYANLSLRIADANKDKMIAMVSHELRNPLNGILGMIYIIEKKIQDVEVLRYLTVCKNSGKLLLNLVNSILDLGQIRNNKFKLSISRGILSEVLQETYLLFDFQFRQKSLYLSFEAASSAPKYIITDLNRLRQILINLIANALKFTFEGGVTVYIHKDPRNDENLLFKVSDTGIGIKDEEKKKLFKMYGRLDQADQKINAEGVGLGLTISDHLVRLLSCDKEGESIRVESQYGKGTTLSFSIKANLQDFSETNDKDRISHIDDVDVSINEEGHTDMYKKLSTHMLQSNRGLNTSRISFQMDTYTSGKGPNSIYYDQEKEQTRKNSFDQMNRLSSCADGEEEVLIKKANYKGYVLLADDNPFNIMVAKNIIEGLNYWVETALNGKIAVDMVKKAALSSNPFDVVFMDCHMPVMNGYEATTQIRGMVDNEIISKVPIVAFSANDAEDDRKKCREVGMNGHLPKPFSESRLRAILEKYCQKKNINKNEKETCR